MTVEGWPNPKFTESWTISLKYKISLNDLDLEKVKFCHFMQPPKFEPEFSRKLYIVYKREVE